MTTFRLAAALSCASLALAGAHAASATVLVSDNFNSDTQALNWPGDGIFISRPAPSVQGEASTDLIGNNGPFPYCEAGATNQCVDLDGSTGSGNNPAGKLVTDAKFGPGTYTVTFDLGGNDRGAPDQTTRVKMGNFFEDITLSSDSPWKTYSFTFTTDRTSRLKFKEFGPSDQQGNLLDDVQLSTSEPNSDDIGPNGGGGVPEPATWTMMILGVGAIGAMGRRTRRTNLLATA